jgi:hypothetical protein
MHGDGNRCWVLAADGCQGSRGIVWCTFVLCSRMREWQVRSEQLFQLKLRLCRHMPRYSPALCLRLARASPQSQQRRQLRQTFPPAALSAPALQVGAYQHCASCKLPLAAGR